MTKEKEPKERLPKRVAIRIVKDPASGQHVVESVSNSSEWSPGDAITKDEIDELISDDDWNVHVKAGKERK